MGRVLRARFGESFEVVAVDRTGGPGLVRANLAVELPAVAGRFDLVVAAHLLNELFVDRQPAERVALRVRRIRAWSTLLAPNGVLILIEPALRDTSRELLAVRDQVLAAGGLHVLAPCFWTGPCPALALERDWCHDAAPVPSKPRVDFSYLVLRAEPVPPAPTLNRVVSDPMPEKGRLAPLRLRPPGPPPPHPSHPLPRPPERRPGPRHPWRRALDHRHRASRRWPPRHADQHRHDTRPARASIASAPKAAAWPRGPRVNHDKVNELVVAFCARVVGAGIAPVLRGRAAGCPFPAPVRRTGDRARSRQGGDLLHRRVSGVDRWRWVSSTRPFRRPTTTTGCACCRCCCSPSRRSSSPACWCSTWSWCGARSLASCAISSRGSPTSSRRRWCSPARRSTSPRSSPPRSSPPRSSASRCRTRLATSCPGWRSSSSATSRWATGSASTSASPVASAKCAGGPRRSSPRTAT